MKSKKNSCKAGLKKLIIRKDIFEREIDICQKLCKEGGIVVGENVVIAE